LGLVGFGNVAQKVLKMAKALELKVIVHTKKRIDGLEDKLGFKYVSLDQLLARADIVSLHIPANEKTEGFVSCDLL